MFDRIDLKRRARLTLRKNYGIIVLVALIFSIINGTTATTAGTSAGGGAYRSESKSLSEFLVSFLTFHLFDEFINTYGKLFLFLFLLLLVYVVVNTFLLNPLKVGCHRFFLLNTNENPGIKVILFAFQSNYRNIIKTMFLRDLYTFLWLLLFLIPGFVKSYSYRMVPYLLAEDPNLPSRDALQISMNMMSGFKLSTFVLDLSFFGWALLSSFTLGLSGVLFSGPYSYATNAELYVLLSGSNRREEA